MTLMITQRLRQAYQRWRDFTWRGPSGHWLAVTALVLVLGLAGVLVAAWMGFNQGLVDRQQSIQAAIDDHFTRGLAHAQDGRKGLAAAEFEMVLRLDPQHEEAKQQLAALLATPEPTPEPTGLRPPPPRLVGPAGATPAPVTPTLSLADQVFQQAESAMEQGDWLLGSDLLEELSALDPAYRPEDVATMRFDAWNQYALDLLGGGHYEEALRAFDDALELRPQAAEVRNQRELLALYVEVLGRWGLNWPSVVSSLRAIYQDQPEYLDVAHRLALAEAAWGEDLAKEGLWCQAAEHLDSALVMESTAQVLARQEELAAFCADPGLAPTQVASQETPTGETPRPGTAEPASGSLIYATYAPEFQRWTVFRASLSNPGQPVPLAEAASQPSISRAGDRVAMRSERGDRTGLAVMPVRGGEWVRVTYFAEDGRPTWSPDGRQVAFHSNREGDRRWRIYRTGSQGGQEVVLGFGRWPTWSPDGQSIAYQGCDERGNRCGVWLVGTDGANPRPLTTVAGDAMPAWSPSGRWLAFASAERTGSWDVFLVDVQTGEVRPLATGPSNDGHPTWSADGTQVAFLSNREGSWAIYLADITSGRISRGAKLVGELPDWLETQIGWGP